MKWQIYNPNYQPIGEPLELKEAVAKAKKLLEDKGYDRKEFVVGVDPPNWEYSKTPIKVGLFRRGLMGGRISSGYTIFRVKTPS